MLIDSVNNDTGNNSNGSVSPNVAVECYVDALESYKVVFVVDSIKKIILTLIGELGAGFFGIRRVIAASDLAGQGCPHQASRGKEA